MNQLDPMAQPLNRLERLPRFLPGQRAEVYEFGAFLRKRLRHEHLTADKFVTACEIALDDLRHGECGITGQKLNLPLANRRPEEYAELRRRISYIAEAIFPPEIAAEANRFLHDLDAEAAQV